MVIGKADCHGVLPITLVTDLFWASTPAAAQQAPARCRPGRRAVSFLL
ncbi:hypothetical protein [Amycolatopsis japonica]